MFRGMPLWAYGGLAFVLGAAGILISGLWRRAGETGGGAERFFALFATLVVLGCVGWIASASLAGTLSAGARFPLSAASEGVIAVAFSVLFVGTWRLFRPASRAAAAASIAAIALLAAAWIAGVAEGRPLEPGEARYAAATLSTGRAAALAWWGTECLLYFARMRRRLALGLADREQTERFGYLGLGSILVTGALALVPISGWLLGRLPREVPAILATIVWLASFGVVGIVLGLLPGRWISRLPVALRLCRNAQPRFSRAWPRAAGRHARVSRRPARSRRARSRPRAPRRGRRPPSRCRCRGRGASS
jgi:hypothetical protein